MELTQNSTCQSQESLSILATPSKIFHWFVMFCWDVDEPNPFFVVPFAALEDDEVPDDWEEKRTEKHAVISIDSRSHSFFGMIEKGRV